jgi:chemotaxis protein MotC
LRVLALTLALSGAAHADTQAELAPFEMVRSLQHVQDRIAGGDHAALPMQKKLLEMIDDRFRRATIDEFADKRNFRSLLIYAMSGGNPATISPILDQLELDDRDSTTAAGVIAYLEGDIGEAYEAISKVALDDYPTSLGAFLALVKGSVTGAKEPEAGMALLDVARLLGPGTLVEEAALRRSIALAVSHGDAERFMTATEQYARRFLSSPYAAQFAEEFVAGIAKLDGKLDMARVGNAIDWMSAEQAKSVYLRIARHSAINGNDELLALASQKAREYADMLPGEDPRSELYSSISSVTSETVVEVLARLEELDPSQFTRSDRALLKAAKSVAADVVAPVGDPPAAVLVDEAEAEPPVEQTAGQDVSAANDILTSARSKLEAIDKLLEETKE